MGCMRLYIRELGEVCCVEVQPLRQPLHQVRALVSGEGAGGETHRQLGVTFEGPCPYRDTRSYSAVKMLFFREILPQFIPTNGSLHTSKSYGCLNGWTAHMCTLTERHTRHAQTRQTNTQRAMPREKGSAASSGLVNHLLFSSNETNNKVQMEPAWGVMAVSYGRAFLSLFLPSSFFFFTHVRFFFHSHARRLKVKHDNTKYTNARATHAPSRWDENNKVQMEWGWSVMVVW